LVLFFPDNTVLVNFAIVRRIDLLETLANGNGRWCLTVSAECDKSARIEGLEDLRQVRRFLGNPLIPTAIERVTTNVLRDAMARPGDDPHKHLGEAETVAIVTSRTMTSAVIFVSDDGSALDLAAAHGIRVTDTWGLLALAVRVRKVTDSQRISYESLLAANGRTQPRRGRK
jgi:predicted nucleic acid-binding protein